MSRKLNKYVIESLKHWFRMRRWVRKQDKKEKLNVYAVDTMRFDIKENWLSEFCLLCNINNNNCKTCILCDSAACEMEIWGEINVSKTWGEWLKNSNFMIRELWKYRYKDK